ncbi:MAG: hypothetical protein IT256_04790 [Chitinophagaceae bacterium]|nr:hypothetical protein [Chitinophagaceae bacterium]
MKMPFALILFCWMLLPGAGSGQGVIINEAIDSRLSNDKFSDRFIPSSEFSFNDSNQVFKKNRVKSVSVMYAKPKRQEGKVLYRIRFDTAGKIISQYFITNWKLYSVQFDTFVSEKNRIFTRQVFKLPFESRYFAFDSLKKLLQVDSLIEEVCNYKNNDTQIHFITIKNKSYKTGELINSRNSYYNHNFFEDRRIDFDAFELLHFRDNFPSDITKTISNSFYQHYKEDSIYLTKYSQYSMDFNSSKTLSQRQIKKHPFIKANYKKQAVNYYVEGESFVEPKRYIGRCGFRNQIDTFKRMNISKNKKGLDDSVFIEYYPIQKDSVCHKPKDPYCDFYLKGRSGIPKREPIYVFRYEYFDE